MDWDGNYETLDSGREKFTTYINLEKFRDLFLIVCKKLTT